MKQVTNSSIIRMLLGLIICIATIIIGQQIFIKIPGVNSLNIDLRNFFKGILVSGLLIYSYILFYRKFEKRPITEFRIKENWKPWAQGLLIGFILQSLTILIIFLFAGFKIISVSSLTTLIIPFTVAFTVAIIEETLLRGIIFRITEEKLGSITALIISGIIFGALHLINPHVTILSAICISIIGVLLSAAYMCYRNLWFPIAIHFAWNFTQNGIFGAITSGTEKTSSLLTTKIEGPEIVTGGKFGPEGAIQALIFCLILTIVMLRKLNKQNKMIRYSAIVKKQ